MAAPLVWRQVNSLQETVKAAAAVAAEPGPDCRLQIAQIQSECEQKTREGHAAGLREGEAAGRSRAAAELQPVVERLARAMDELANLRGRLRSEAEGDLIKLSLAIARRVLRRELAIDPEALHGLVLAALEKLQAQEICRVKVHPSHAAAVTACLQKVVTGATVEVVPDYSREPGAIIFETSRGNLDVSVESQLQEIERGLADRLRKHS
ncbi:MAG TPA: FliH/SctL family protein [Candidatus Acidoferrales bacterium]|nr:FliH/SctL family protein [Candidatus Acidoferrales bacterium]